MARSNGQPGKEEEEGSRGGERVEGPVYIEERRVKREAALGRRIGLSRGTIVAEAEHKTVRTAG